MSPARSSGATPRSVVVHDRVEPALSAGDYTVRATQSVSGPPGSAVPDDVRHLRVTGPRYRLPANEILSTFPPANADGPFSTRLAQVALKRRTLPWERMQKSTKQPWLALILLSDGEGRYRPSVPVEAAVTPGVLLSGENPDGPTCAAIEVSDRVVAQVFPSRQDLPYTSHVREVPLDDTELAQGDDDGSVAVVLGTRLPRQGVRYRACLVSLEGQWHELPDNPPVEAAPSKTHVYDLADGMISDARVPHSDGVPLQVATEEPSSVGGFDRETIANALPSAPAGHVAADAWSAAASFLPAAAASGAPGGESPAAMGPGAYSVALDVSYQLVDPGARLLTFPVLASWEFRCEGGSDFAALVQNLDVGLLGTADRPGRGPADRVPEVTETGHVVLAGSDRTGEAVSSWYRGPLVPRAVARRTPSAVHVADQLRRVAEDGRPEVGEAAAFELGRLLALSHPSTVAALREWRRRGFTTRRAAAVGEASLLSDLLSEWDLLAGKELDVVRLAPELGKALLTDIGGEGVLDDVLPFRPGGDPMPEDFLGDVAATLATGLDVPLRELRQALEGASPAVTEEMLGQVTALGFEELSSSPGLLAPLALGLQAGVGELTAMAEQHLGPGPGPGPGPVGPVGPSLFVSADDAHPGDADEPDTVEGLFPGAVPTPNDLEDPR
jgi:hypothetical protein